MPPLHPPNQNLVSQTQLPFSFYITARFSSFSYYSLSLSLSINKTPNYRTITLSKESSSSMASRCMSSLFYCDTVEYDSEIHYYLDSCSLCKKPLSKNRDIFMYRGDAPFCSEECRQEQIEIDQEKEFRRKHKKVGSLNGKKGSRDLKQRQEECDSNQRIPVAAGAW